MAKPIADRFWAKVDKGPGCWEWTAGKNAKGYGRMSVYRNEKYNAMLAHRIGYEISVGPIPEGLGLDHTCHNPGCVNPAHLRVVTQKQNLENLAGAFSTSKSGVRGVCWEERRNLWRATVTHNRKQHHVGHFANIEDAEAAVVVARKQLFTHNDRDR